MHRSLRLAVVVVFLAIAAPAQAQITGSTITTPADPHFVLIDPDAPTPTVSISGTATGSGSVDIVCLRDYVGYGDVFAGNVPVAADGTFAVADVPLISEYGVRVPTSQEGTCRLLAWPAGTTPANRDAFSGPRLAISKIGRVARPAGSANAGVVVDAYVVASGVGFSTLSRPFGYLGVNDAAILDPATFKTATSSFYGSGGLGFDQTQPRFALEIDGQAAYPPAVAASGIGSASTYANPGLDGVKIDVTRFSPTTGDMTVRETTRLIRCAPDNVYPPTADSCQSFTPAPVALVRTTEFSHGGQAIRVVDRWTSTDGRRHRLDLSLSESPCLGSGYDCSASVAHRLPGEAAYSARPAGTSTGAVGPGAILSRDASDPARGGNAVILGQRADSIRFRRDTYNEVFVLDYRARTIPATGSLTMSHTYALTRSAGEIESLVAALTPAPPAAQPHPGTTTQPAAAPVVSRHGHVRVRRSGRTFLVRTRDWVQCAAGCTVSVRGARVRSSSSTLAAGATARVTFTLNRRGVRALTRTGRLRVTVSIAAQAANGAPVTRVRHLTLRRR
ncbi:MAG TPA: hypothetical protein VFX51_28815 [Solirubrobacteraceae bacterium]|nr:hypothetical protein [Solirubrobacteraceae bacterium]